MQAMIAKGHDTSSTTKDGCLPVHFFVECGLQKEIYNLTEDAEFLDMVFFDLIKDVPPDFCLTSV